MSRRHLTLVVVAIASLSVSACGSSPTGPRPASTPNHDTVVPPPPAVGTMGSNG